MAPAWPAPAALLLALQAGAAAAEGDFQRFCGIATTDRDAEALAAAQRTAGAGKVWHYNWLESTSLTPKGMEFAPMVKTPGWNANLLPAPTTGALVLSWNEPDDAGQAGSDPDLRQNPTDFAFSWTEQMQTAQSKGYTEFVSPAMAFDTCWLDFFLKSCETVSGCKELVTYLGVHHYRGDCDSYVADPGFEGWRDDLSYILSYYRLMEKYNARGFKIRGLVWDELGCDGANNATAQGRYMQHWYEDTILKVKHADQDAIKTITGTPWIMPKGPDAEVAGAYRVGMCRAEDGGPNAGAEAVKALQSLVTVAWFGIAGDRNLLFNGTDLSELGIRYFTSCRNVPPVQPLAFMT